MADVLVVEDEQWVADCYCQWLRAAGHTAHHARDAQTALDMIDRQLPAVIMLDLLLPHANGVQLLHTLQSYTDMANIPVIICSGSLPADIPPLAPYGVCKVLNKTALHPHDVWQAVEEAMKYAAV